MLNITHNSRNAIPYVVILGMFGTAYLAASPRYAAHPDQDGRTTKLHITPFGSKPEDKSSDIPSGNPGTNGNIPAGFPVEDQNGKVKGGTVRQPFNVGLEFKRSNAPGAEADPNLIGYYVQHIRFVGNLTYRCNDDNESLCADVPPYTPNDPANCPPGDIPNADVPESEGGLISWSYVEYKEITFSDYGLDPNGPSDECLTIPEIDQSQTPEAGGNTFVLDTFSVSPEGKGCWILMVSNSYFVMSSHPHFDDIGGYLDANDEEEDGAIPRPDGDDQTINDRLGDIWAAMPRRPPIPPRNTDATSGFDGGFVTSGKDSDGMPNPNDDKYQELEDLLNDTETEPGTGGTGTTTMSENSLGRTGSTTNEEPGGPGPIAQWLFIEYDTCGNSGDGDDNVKAGVGFEELIDCVELFEDEEGQGELRKLLDNAH